ncbi:MAG: NADH-quinone oxidoreductase subunit A [Archaeoglobaceae archaeon]|nr:NADH-quinone oxidoreductase subunit A [Archaeoglobaceae archaeon]MCX8151932.1 NADH-quinone oxidoreductase subunit A [Archaeoglobaceae archaeon]MDW8013321.1 NADH-quinone oxidoreductase subunit A [Archaeoglobaceae archaeon]
MVESILIVLIIIAVTLIIDLVIVVLAKILPKYKPTPVKLSRFEAGNVPVGFQKWKLPMQYIGFMVLFMTLEPVAVLLLLFAALPTIDVYAITLIALVMFLPVVYVGYDYSLEIAKLR